MRIYTSNKTEGNEISFRLFAAVLGVGGWGKEGGRAERWGVGGGGALLVSADRAHCTM